jgi:tetrahydromethanopterin S-methyltransferase subunit B
MSLYDPFEHMTNKDKREILEKSYKALREREELERRRQYDRDPNIVIHQMNKIEKAIDKLEKAREKVESSCCGCGGCLGLLMPPTGICSIIGALVGVICGIIMGFSELYENWSVAVACILGLAYGCGWVGAIIDRIIHWVKYR